MRSLARLGLLAAAALVTVVGLSSTGCAVSARAGGGADVYCDATGCYQCDAYTCSPAPGSSGGSAASSSSGGASSVDSGPIVAIGADAATASTAEAGVDSAPPAPPPDCVTTDDCTSPLPQACIGGYCRYTCTSSKQCAEIDARLDTCNETDGGAGYCVGSAD